jgi:hypothetical protein
MNMTRKSIVTSAAAVTAIAAAAAGFTSIVSGAQSVVQVQPASFGAPLPQDPPAPGLPSPQQLSALLTQVTDPGVGYEAKNNLVENGITPQDGHAADHDLRKAFHDGKFPQQYNVTNIAPAGPNGAQADVAITGPKLAGPVGKHLFFVNQGGNWVLQHDSALALIQAATS